MSAHTFNKYVGRTFLYGGLNVLIKDIVEKEGGDLYVFLDSGKRIPISKRDFKEEFILVESSSRKGAGEGMIVYPGYEEDKTTLKTLSETLLANIQKLQADPTFIKQADAIGRQVRGIIDLQKVKLQAVSAMRK